MASLKGFQRRIKRRGKELEDGVNRITQDVAIAVDQTVVLATPVDTGRARANWLPSVGSPDHSSTQGLDPSGAAAISAARSTFRRRKKGALYIVNNLDYIQALNEGSSAQAPAGFVEAAVKTGINAVKRARRIFK